SPDQPVIRYLEVEPGRSYGVDGVRITPILVNHLVPTVGYQVEDDHSAFIFTSDTGPTDAVYEAANAAPNLKLFITEASFPNAQEWLAEASRHLTPASLGRELKKLNPGIPVGVYHLTPGDREAMLPELDALKDPRVFLLEQEQVFTWGD
ncbi:MAG TPA: hypothetical protein PKO12_06620, partial [Holophaga sp.]|nr:hypothetical protein [Holophaga sp.]